MTHLDSTARMSQAVVHDGTVYLAGQVAKGATIADQANKVLAQIDDLLERCGTSKANLLSATIWLADLADFEAMNKVWDRWIEGVRPPVRATGQVTLAAPAYRIEVIVVAAIAVS